MSLHVEVLRDIEDADTPSDEQFIQWAELALQTEQSDSELCIRLVDAQESQQLNAEYRGKDYPTNILSFPCDEIPGVPIKILGDLAICVEKVRSEASEQSKPLEHHWAHLVIHGVLHLQGFDHIKDEEAEVMEAIERTLLAQLGIPDPYTH